MALESIVRPFQSSGVINDKKRIVTQVLKVTTEQALITWGSVGSTPQSKQTGIRLIIKGDDVQKPFMQKSRQTTDIDVTNPDDPSQKVTVRRADEIQFQRPKPFADNTTGQPTDVPPGQQPPSGGALYTPSPPSGFSDGSSGTTITKTDSSGDTTSFVNGNTNVVATSNAGAVTTAPEKRNEVITLKLSYDDAGSGGSIDSQSIGGGVQGV